MSRSTSGTTSHVVGISAPLLASCSKSAYAERKATGTSMAETTINMIDALQGQLAQLKRLLAQREWISKAPKATLSEMEAQVIEVKRLLAELEKNIQDQLQRGQ
jgi:hypothetical protein